MQPLVSIIIPVKNGEDYLQEVLVSIFSQKIMFDFEVIVIDSGSKDLSLEIIKKFNVKLLQISPNEFNHGGTRNMGVEKSQGKFVAFLTQDATPIDENWLTNIVQPLIDNPKIAGVFGKHLPRKNCDPIVAANLIIHFDKNISNNRKVWIKDNDYENKKGDYIFFSNNNSCIRKSVWREIPFRHVEMSEDQWWATDILEAGYMKCYEPNAIVYHSHNYSPMEWMRRQYDEYRSYKQMEVVKRISVFRALLSLFYSCLNDFRKISRDKSLTFKQRCYWSLQRLLNNLGMIVGQFLGSRYDSILSLWKEENLSEQSRNIKK
jgi:glycosyltransferase involved in cell wall biosynthesis